MRVFSRRLACLLPLWLLFLCAPLAAHPHVFVLCDAGLAFDGQGLAAIRQTWTFDELFTAMILGDLGLPPDKPLNAAAQTRIRDHAFVNLKNFGYFTVIHLDGRRIPTPDAARFAARLRDGQLIYDFELPLRASVGKKPLHLSFSVYDESYYTFIEFPPRDLALHGAEGYRVRWDVARWNEAAYAFGQIIPDAVEAEIARP